MRDSSAVFDTRTTRWETRRGLNDDINPLPLFFVAAQRTNYTMEASADNRFLAVGAGMPEVNIFASDWSRVRPSRRKLRKQGPWLCRPILPRDTQGFSSQFESDRGLPVPWAWAGSIRILITSSPETKKKSRSCMGFYLTPKKGCCCCCCRLPR